MNHEIEVKLRCDDIRRIEDAGIHLEIEAGRHFEDNWLIDDEARSLSGRASVLRIRSAVGRGALTYKAPPAADAAPTRFKQRVEIETSIDDPAAALEMFSLMGYRSWFRYQKYRTVYRARLPGGGRLHVMFDETPIGNFVELEGQEDAIAEAVELLGASPAEHIVKSYIVLQMERCAEAGLPLEDMVFGSGEIEKEGTLTER